MLLLLLLFSYQRSRKASVRLHALSFYLQEKKVGRSKRTMVAVSSSRCFLLISCPSVFPREGRHQRRAGSDAAGETLSLILQHPSRRSQPRKMFTKSVRINATERQIQTRIFRIIWAFEGIGGGEFITLCISYVQRKDLWCLFFKFWSRQFPVFMKTGEKIISAGEFLWFHYLMQIGF